MRALRNAILPVFVGWLISGSTALAQDGLSQSEVTACEAKIAQTMKSKSIPGLSVAIGRAGKIVWARGFGHADLENQVAATADTVYRLASISKPITAVAVMQLVEQGKFDLDVPVQSYVPEFPKKRFRLTTRNLLSHQGGVRHYRAREIFSTRHYETVTAALKIFSADRLLHEPGDKYHYTTYGYNLVGAAAVGASRTGFVDYLQANIFGPAGMTKTREDKVDAIIPHRAQGYRRGPRGRILNAHIVDTSNKIPGGGLCGTAGDLVRFCHALQAGKLLKPSTLDQMWTPARTIAGKRLPYGLGFRITKADKPRIVGHSGGQPRVSTMMLFRPDENIVVALMSNLESAGLHPLALELSGLVLQSK